MTDPVHITVVALLFVLSIGGWAFCAWVVFTEAGRRERGRK